MLKNRRAEEMSRAHSLREFVDLTIHNLESISHYRAKRLDSDIPRNFVSIADGGGDFLVPGV